MLLLDFCHIMMYNLACVLSDLSSGVILVAVILWCVCVHFSSRVNAGPKKS